MAGTVLGPEESALNQTDSVSALLKLPFHQEGCKILAIRPVLRQWQFAVGVIRDEGRVGWRAKRRERWSLWLLISELRPQGWKEW